jgi:FkbM family methyltransferase
MLKNQYKSRFHFAARLFKEAIQDLFTNYWGLNGLDARLAALMPYQGGYFVELGANDGRTQSNTLHFERHKSWKGVLIEPCPTAYMRCIMTRSKATQVFCGCCVHPSKAGHLIPMEYFNLMTVQVDGVTRASSKENIERLRLNQGGEPDLAYKFGSYSCTLADMLNIAKSPFFIDLLSLDVEGAEMAVIAGIDFSKYKFKFILVETLEEPVVSEALRPHGYILRECLTDHDFLYEFKQL